MTITSDRGSDCHSAGHCLAFSSDHKINCSLWWDNSHDSYRGVLESIKCMGLYPFIVLCMVVINLDHGPDDVGMRFNQMLALAQKTLPHMKPHTTPLFLDLHLSCLVCLFRHFDHHHQHQHHHHLQQYKHQHHHHHHHHHYHLHHVPQTVFAHRGLDYIDWICLYDGLCFGIGFVKVAV